MTRSTLVAAAALAAALIAPATTLAGGWATVGLSSLPDGARPGGEEQAFVAEPTERSGVYRARVVFPSAGEWSYSVDDDFSQVHELGSVRIGDGDAQATPAAATPRPAAGPPDSGDGATLAGALGIALGAGLLAALLTTVLRRRGEPKPAEG
jgi:hypothetical protein